MSQPDVNTREVPPPVGDVVNTLWRILVIGLLVIIVAAGVAAFALSMDAKQETDPQPFLTLATAGLTGLLGLFVNPKNGA